MKVLLGNPRREGEAAVPVRVHRLPAGLGTNPESVPAVIGIRRLDRVSPFFLGIVFLGIAGEECEGRQPCIGCGAPTPGECAFCKLAATVGGSGS